MVVRYEYVCPECQKEFLASKPYPKCPRCGYSAKDEEEGD